MNNVIVLGTDAEVARLLLEQRVLLGGLVLKNNYSNSISKKMYKLKSPYVYLNFPDANR